MSSTYCDCAKSKSPDSLVLSAISLKSALHDTGAPVSHNSRSIDGDAIPVRNVGFDLQMVKIPQIVLSSRNKKKIGEIAELFAPHGIDLIGVSEFPGVSEVEEDGDSFAANAGKKASEVAIKLNRWVIAEDSGLCVDALNGAPGIHSARYAGQQGADAANNEKLLLELASVPTEKRTAHYVCYAVLSDPTGQVRLASEGKCGGLMLREYRGENGFGYDPLFLVPEYHLTFGQLTPAVKRHISHRAKALERLIPQIVRLFETQDGK